MDTGSTASYINEDVAKYLETKKVPKYYTVSKIKLDDGSIKET